MESNSPANPGNVNYDLSGDMTDKPFLSTNDDNNEEDNDEHPTGSSQEHRSVRQNYDNPPRSLQLPGIGEIIPHHILASNTETNPPINYEQMDWDRLITYARKRGIHSSTGDRGPDIILELKQQDDSGTAPALSKYWSETLDQIKTRLSERGLRFPRVSFTWS